MSMILADTNQTIPEVQCISAASEATNTTLIAPNGVNIISTTYDPFDVDFDAVNDPGFLTITQDAGHVVIPSYEGIYSCNFKEITIPTTSVHFGIYRHTFNGWLQWLFLLKHYYYIISPFFPCRLHSDHRHIKNRVYR